MDHWLTVEALQMKGKSRLSLTRYYKKCLLVGLRKLPEMGANFKVYGYSCLKLTNLPLVFKARG